MVVKLYHLRSRAARGHSQGLGPWSTRQKASCQLGGQITHWGFSMFRKGKGEYKGSSFMVVWFLLVDDKNADSATRSLSLHSNYILLIQREKGCPFPIHKILCCLNDLIWIFLWTYILCMSTQQKNWCTDWGEEVPVLVYTVLMCKPVIWFSLLSNKKSMRVSPPAWSPGLSGLQLSLSHLIQGWFSCHGQSNAKLYSSSSQLDETAFSLCL